MKDEGKTEAQLIVELAELRQRIAELKTAETEHQRAEESLRRSEEAYRLLFEQSVDGIVIVARGRIVRANQAFCAFHGLPAEKVVGMSPFDLVHPDDRDIGARRIAAIQSGAPVRESRVYRALRADGTIRWGEVRSKRIEWEGEPALQSVVCDVTERKQAEEERELLLAAEREQRELAETLREVVSILNASLDREQVLQLILEQLARVVNYDSASLMLVTDGVPDIAQRPSLGKRTLDIVAYRGFRSETQLFTPLLVEALPTARELIEHRRPIIIPDTAADPRWWCLPGVEYIRCWLGVPLIVQDRVIGMLNLDKEQPNFYTERDAEIAKAFADQSAIAIENARLFESERAQLRLARTLQEVGALLTTRMSLEEVFERIFDLLAQVVEYDSVSVQLLDEEGDMDIVAGRGFPDFEQAKQIVRAVANRTLEDRFDQHRVVVIPDTHADPRWIQGLGHEHIRSWIGAALLVKGRLAGVLNVDSITGNAYDATTGETVAAFANQAAIAIENARLYEDLQNQMVALKHTQAQLIQSAKMAAIGELASGVAHELNNPLTSVLGFAELVLRNAVLEETARKDLTIVVKEAHRARDIVRALLDFARQTEFRLEPADVNQVVRESLAFIRRRLTHSDVTVQEHYALGLPIVLLDTGRMKQVFLNLAANAVDAMPQGGTLTVTSEQVGDDVAVHITDTGVGIPAANLPRIFEPFFTTKPVDQGTGLGLSVSLGIVEQHGGYIEVESQEGQGSTFTVWLPVDTADE